jgi:hypothetical protein
VPDLPKKTYEILGGCYGLRIGLLLDERDRVIFDRDGKMEAVGHSTYADIQSMFAEEQWHWLLNTQRELRELADSFEEVKRRLLANVKDPENLTRPFGWGDG